LKSCGLHPDGFYEMRQALDRLHDPFIGSQLRCQLSRGRLTPRRARVNGQHSAP